LFAAIAVAQSRAILQRTSRLFQGELVEFVAEGERLHVVLRAVAVDGIQDLKLS